MDEEMPKGFFARNRRTCVLCGRAAAALSVLALVPLVRNRRAHRQHARRRFPILGH